MPVLVTGGAGFIGSHLVEALLARGEAVEVLDDLSTGALENLASVAADPRLRVVVGSCEDPALVRGAAERCDVIYHLAAAVGVELIVARPVETIERNVRLTEVLFREAARLGRRVVFTSTSEVYGKGTSVPFREDDDILLGPPSRARWSYAGSKLLDEFLALAYAHEGRLRVTVTRLFNTIGPRQTGRFGMVLPRLVGQALEGRPLTVYGDGGQSRCFCDVADVVRALLAVPATQATEGEVLNLGAEREISIRELAERVRAIVNPSCEIAVVPYDRAYAPGFEDMRRRVPDTSKALRLLGWRAEVPLDVTIERVAAYMRGR